MGSFWGRCASVAVCAVTLLFWGGEVAAQSITPDASGTGVGSSVSSGPNYVISGGTQAGANLFHSFQNFSVNTGETAHFSLSDVSTQNIIGRVVGPNVSNIDGLLKADGHANVFLLNPNGIVVGPNAVIDIGGQLHLTAADYIGFSGGERFSTTSAPALVTSAPPESFGFVGPRTGLSGLVHLNGLNGSTNSATDSTPGVGLGRATGFSFTGREVTVQGAGAGSDRALINAERGGPVLVGAIMDGSVAGTEIFLDTAADAPATGVRGVVRISNSYIKSVAAGTVDGKTIRVIGGNVDIFDSVIESRSLSLNSCEAQFLCFNFNDGIKPNVPGVLSYYDNGGAPGSQSRIHPGTGQLLIPHIDPPPAGTFSQVIYLDPGMVGHTFGMYWATPDAVNSIEFYRNGIPLYTESGSIAASQPGYYLINNIVFDTIRLVTSSNFYFESDLHFFEVAQAGSPISTVTALPDRQFYAFRTTPISIAESGDIRIDAVQLSISNSSLMTESETYGDSGSIILNSLGNVSIFNSLLDAQTPGSSAIRDAGRVSIAALAGEITLSNSDINANTNSVPFNPGDIGTARVSRSGDIDLRAKKVSIINGSTIRNEGGSNGTADSASGNIVLSATGCASPPCLTISDSLLTNEVRSNNQGGVTILNSPSILIDGNTQILSDTESNGGSGFVLMGHLGLDFLDAALKFGEIDEVDVTDLNALLSNQAADPVTTAFHGLLDIINLLNAEPDAGLVRGSDITIRGNSLISAASSSTGIAGSIVLVGNHVLIADDARLVSDSRDGSIIREGSVAFSMGLHKDDPAYVPGGTGISPNPDPSHPKFGDVGGILITGDLNLEKLLPRLTSLRSLDQTDFIAAVGDIRDLNDSGPIVNSVGTLLGFSKPELDTVLDYLVSDIAPGIGEAPGFTSAEAVLQYINHDPLRPLQDRIYRGNVNSVTVTDRAQLSAINRSGEVLIGGSTTAGKSGGIAILSDHILANGTASLRADTGQPGAAVETSGGVERGGSIFFGLSRIPIVDLRILGDAQVSTSSYGSGLGGSINVTTVNDGRGFVDIVGSPTLPGGSINFNQSGLYSSLKGGSGAAGSIVVNTPRLTVDGGSIATNVFSVGDASKPRGSVTVTASDVLITNEGSIEARTYGRGQSGDISVVASNSIRIIKDGRIDIETVYSGPVLTPGDGKAGSMFLSAPLIEILSDGGLFSGSEGSGDGGVTTIIADNLLRIEAIDPFCTICAHAGITGDGGDVIVRAGDIIITGDGSIAILTSTREEGDAGNVDIQARGVFSLDHARVESVSEPDPIGCSFCVASGSNGSVQILADSISLTNGASVRATAGADTLPGPAESIRFGANTIIIADSFVLNETAGGKDAGLIEFGGYVSGTAASLVSLKNASVSTETSSLGNAGQIALESLRLLMDNSVFSTASVSGGNAGQITIGSLHPIDSLLMINRSEIKSTAEGSGHASAGTVSIRSRGGRLEMIDSRIATLSDTAGLAGAIKIGFDAVDKAAAFPGDGFADIILRDCSRIITQAASAAAGDIDLLASDTIQILESQVVSEVLGGSGNGGDIRIDPRFVILRNAKVDSSAAGGAGGDVTITTNYFLRSESELDLAGGAANGELVVSGPEIGTEAVSVLDATILNVLDRLPTECGLRLGRVGGSLTPVGRGGVGLVPGENHFADYPRVDDWKPTEARRAGVTEQASLQAGWSGTACN